MDAIWQYIAGVSLLFPMVRKNKLSKPKTSEMIVSTRFGSDGAGSIAAGLDEEGGAFAARFEAF